MNEKPRVLLIDDSELTLEGLKIYLSSRFEVVTATDGFSALKDFDHSFDLIITDLLFPATSGFGLISSLRQQHPRTPIIAMTGWGKPLWEDEPKVDAVLMKPFERDVLDEIIGRVLLR